MNAEKKNGIMIERMVWSALFIWWGLSFIPGFMPNGLDAAGTGIILLGVNLFRRARGKRMDGISMAAGILCLVWGGLDLAESVLHVPYKLPVFAVLLVVLGIIVLVSAFFRDVGLKWEGKASNSPLA
jgi:hypothetical protein